MPAKQLAIATVVLLGLVAGLALPVHAAPPPQTPAAPPADLANATYLSDYTGTGSVTLVDGEFDDRTNFVHVVLTDWIARGDLDGDGTDDAAVVLATNTGGSGIFLDLHAMVTTKEGPTDAGSTFLGDRVQINALSVVDGVITIDMVTQGPSDPFCCPTQPVTVHYALEDGALVSEAQLGISLSALQNGAYISEFGDDGTVTLVDGIFEAEAAPASSSRLFVGLTGYTALGDLTGDGVDEAAVILVTSGGGSGTFYDLAVMAQNEEGELVNVATTQLGDRVELQDVAISDGAIVVQMITQGPEDPLCCPTQPVEQLYALEENTLVLREENAPATAAAAKLAELDPAAEALFATLNLGGDDSYWLDPTMVSVLSGVVDGPAIDASQLGAGCAGKLPTHPDVVLNWTQDAEVETLRFFFLSAGDPTMLIVTPAGDYICSDDYNPLVLDPIIEIDAPAEGRYAIFIGAFEDDAVAPGFLTITSQPYNPANLDIAQLLPRALEPDAESEPLTPDVLGSEAPVTATITADATPFQQELTGGGEVGAFNIEVGNPLCTGFIDAAPTFSFEWTGDAETLRIFFEAEADSTLIIKTPLDSFACEDDANGAANLNPSIDLTPLDGTYMVWVGSFAPDTPVTGTLTIASSSNVQPAALSSADLEDN